MSRCLGAYLVLDSKLTNVDEQKDPFENGVKFDVPNKKKIKKIKPQGPYNKINLKLLIKGQNCNLLIKILFL